MRGVARKARSLAFQQAEKCGNDAGIVAKYRITLWSCALQTGVGLGGGSIANQKSRFKALDQY